MEMAESTNNVKDSEVYLKQYNLPKSEWLPTILAIVVGMTVCVPYIIAVTYGPLNFVLPYISEAAGFPPQSGIFAILLFATSVLAEANIFQNSMLIRLCIKRSDDEESKKTIERLNEVLIIIGHTTGISFILIAAFPILHGQQEEYWLYATLVPHTIGAVMWIFGSISYGILYTYTMALCRVQEKRTAFLRIILCCISVCCAIVCLGSVYLEYIKIDDFKVPVKNCRIQRKEYSNVYIVTSSCEWIMIACAVSFLATMREEFKKFSLTITISLHCFNIKEFLKSTNNMTSSTKSYVKVNENHVKIQ